MTTASLCVTAVGVGILAGLAFAAGFRAGLFIGEKRGRALEKMEPPQHGRLHFREGHITQLVAENAPQAIDRLTAPRVVQPRDPRLTGSFIRTWE